MHIDDNPKFPEYLDKGSRGDAVVALYNLLCMIGYSHDLSSKTDRDVYDDLLANVVMALQEKLGLKGDEVDGNFGPQTRELLKGKMGIDVNEVPAEKSGELTVWYGPNTQGPQIHPAV